MNLGIVYYVTTCLSGFRTICLVADGTLGVALVVFFAMFLDSICTSYAETRKNRGTYKKFLKMAVIGLMISTTLTAIVPCKRDILVIAGLSLASESITKTAAELSNTFPSLIKWINTEIENEFNTGE